MARRGNKQSTSIPQVTPSTKAPAGAATPNYGPVCHMPVDDNDEGSKRFYREQGIPVVAKRRKNTHTKGKYALVAPDEEFIQTAQSKGLSVQSQANAFSKIIDNYRRSESRRNNKMKSHEVSLDKMLDSGYDPSSDSIDVVIKISNTSANAFNFDGADKSMGSTSSEFTFSAGTYFDDGSDTFGYRQPSKRGAYLPMNDPDNPEFLLAKSVLYNRLHSLIDEVEGEDLEIVNMIISGQSEHEKAKELGIARSTLHDHKVKLLRRFKEKLKDFYE